jgi:hypothetical protein
MCWGSVISGRGNFSIPKDAFDWTRVCDFSADHDSSSSSSSSSEHPKPLRRLDSSDSFGIDDIFCDELAPPKKKKHGKGSSSVSEDEVSHSASTKLLPVSSPPSHSSAGKVSLPLTRYVLGRCDMPTSVDVSRMSKEWMMARCMQSLLGMLV